MKKNDILIWVFVGAAVVVGGVAVWLIDGSGDSGSGLGDEFTYDVSEYGKTDAKLVMYQELPERFDTGMKACKAIAVSGKKIYVAGDNMIRVVGGKDIKLSGMPRCLAVGEGGKVFVGVDGHVEVYSGAGKQIGVWDSGGEKALFTSIAVYEDNIFVADAGRRVVVRYDLEGNVVNEIGRKDEKRNISGFVIPSPYFDLAVASDGLLRVVNPGEHRIEAYTFDGDLEFSWGEPGIKIEGFCGCCNPVNFAILGDGSFVTVEKGLVRVKLYDEDGKFSGVVAGVDALVPGGVAKACAFPADCQSGGFDVAVDSDGKIYVLDTRSGVVRYFVRKIEPLINTN
ncbi:MAG: hypothetical protein FVQ82_06240 [Planctomycetes bacterium]|nr:hypothetical protein [Planctomycetota bacterium]